MKKKEEKMKGFTLIELVVVMVIIGILTIVAVPIYRGYTRRAMAVEGGALVGGIAITEKIYLVEFGEYHAIDDETNFDTTIDVDARANSYFRNYTVTTNGENINDGGNPEFTAVTNGEGNATGITVRFNQVWNEIPDISVKGLSE